MIAAFAGRSTRVARRLRLRTEKGSIFWRDFPALSNFRAIRFSPLMSIMGAARLLNTSVETCKLLAVHDLKPSSTLVRIYIIEKGENAFLETLAAAAMCATLLCAILLCTPAFAQGASQKGPFQSGRYPIQKLIPALTFFQFRQRKWRARILSLRPWCAGAVDGKQAKTPRNSSRASWMTSLAKRIGLGGSVEELISDYLRLLHE